ncbi:hypothetical protein [Paraliobacillus sediminis]|uniref:hypothetical protein n=1 Tax=Paraliobacillus sediminis TaxID=1885916 RepID=UPI000E3C4ED0|nr:hypothetical protein [Paraliobacillus sediminis]
MKKKVLKFFTGLICATLIVASVGPSVAEAKSGVVQSNEQEEILENELQDIDASLDILTLIEDLPEEIAENGINESVIWLNDNKGETFANQEFVANGEYLELKDVTNKNLIQMASVGGCVWGIAKAIAMNALPWSKILKIKKAVKIMGGTKVVAKTVINAYKHQRNLGYGRAKAIKRAMNVTKRAVPGEYVKHWVELFSLGVVKKQCF